MQITEPRGQATCMGAHPQSRDPLHLKKSNSKREQRPIGKSQSQSQISYRARASSKRLRSFRRTSLTTSETIGDNFHEIVLENKTEILKMLKLNKAVKELDKIEHSIMLGNLFGAYKLLFALEKDPKHEAEAKLKYPKHLVPSRTQQFTEKGFYSWDVPKPRGKLAFFLFIGVLIAIAFMLFNLWPLSSFTNDSMNDLFNWGNDRFVLGRIEDKSGNGTAKRKKTPQQIFMEAILEEEEAPKQEEKAKEEEEPNILDEDLTIDEPAVLDRDALGGDDDEDKGGDL
ncbi:hypothetical protein FGO68_gene1137 [Halteria grandinella]|uniref:Uncharacterized protein n=1 Tax=Halteria grandinella TaxID=5974 RepID=A0A8J8T0X3_HALGN|nr:hypothetical protein FGO68_gene1137 [Halteria grandinella]